MTDDALIKAMTRAYALAAKGQHSCNGRDHQMEAALAVARPIIEAQERERCARVAEGFEANRDWVNGSLWGNIRREVAAAIRETGDE